MEQFDDFSDERNKIFCPYCGRTTEPRSRDHVPSKVLLDKPYPPELPIIYPCRKCNSSYSKDEEYVPCFIECARVGSTDMGKIQREKIRRILQKHPMLATKLCKEIELLKYGKFLGETANRIERLILKLARGHAAFELGEPELNKPTTLIFTPLAVMTADQLDFFEFSPKFRLFAEIGSRAMQRQVQTATGAAEWVCVQPGRYRYLTQYDERTKIRIVMSEYLACEVVW